MGKLFARTIPNSTAPPRRRCAGSIQLRRLNAGNVFRRGRCGSGRIGRNLAVFQSSNLEFFVQAGAVPYSPSDVCFTLWRTLAPSRSRTESSWAPTNFQLFVDLFCWKLLEGRFSLQVLHHAEHPQTEGFSIEILLGGYLGMPLWETGAQRPETVHVCRAH